uniref:Ubiquitin fusion degradation protein 1 homolog n=1 Tax=Lygus hesperus TaxID=30085 RepID=A0A0A9WLL6_LYGHE
MFPFNLFPFGGRQPFRTFYQCLPVAMMAGHEREDVEKGGKIMMPPSALQILTDANISYPMLFKLTNTKLGRSTHCGVLEFVADEGRVYLPLWMMQNLMLLEGDPVEVQNVLLPVATFSRFQPQSKDFLDISNPKAVLENCLRHFACLTTGDVINLKYNDKDYQLSVLETRPSEAVLIIECDMNVEFTAPVGYVEPQQDPNPRKSKEAEEEQVSLGFVAFRGTGNRLDGKSNRRPSDNSLMTAGPPRGVPDFDWRLGTITFNRNVRPEQPTCSGTESKHETFPGLGNTLCQH